MGRFLGERAGGWHGLCHPSSGLAVPCVGSRVMVGSRARAEPSSHGSGLWDFTSLKRNGKTDGALKPCPFGCGDGPRIPSKPRCN